MGKFSGILLCTDFDGTIATGGHVVEENSKAIRYFQENGGMFSVITGRTADFLHSRENELACNTYVGCVNGTVIYDYPNAKTVSREFINGDIFSPLMKIHKELAVSKNLVIFFEDGDTVIHDATDDFEEQLCHALSKPVLKILIHTTRPYNEKELVHIKELFGDKFEQARSWQSGFEIQNKGSNKGKAVKKIAELCGADKIICVGDYENDRSLLEAADLSYAVDNAIPTLKEIAHRTTVSVENGAISAILKDIEKEL